MPKVPTMVELMNELKQITEWTCTDLIEPGNIITSVNALTGGHILMFHPLDGPRLMETVRPLEGVRTEFFDEWVRWSQSTTRMEATLEHARRNRPSRGESRNYGPWGYPTPPKR